MLNEGGLPGHLKSTAPNASPPDAIPHPDRGQASAAARPFSDAKPAISPLSQALFAPPPENPMQQSILQSINPAPVLQQVLMMFHFGGPVKKSGNPFSERLESQSNQHPAPRKQNLTLFSDLMLAPSEDELDREESQPPGKGFNFHF